MQEMNGLLDLAMFGFKTIPILHITPVFNSSGGYQRIAGQTTLVDKGQR